MAKMGHDDDVGAMLFCDIVNLINIFPSRDLKRVDEAARDMVALLELTS